MDTMKPFCSCHSGQEMKNVDSLSLAMAYVPWQRWNQIYKPEEALMQGTIFMELDKPFTGRSCIRR